MKCNEGTTTNLYSEPEREDDIITIKSERGNEVVFEGQREEQHKTNSFALLYFNSRSLSHSVLVSLSCLNIVSRA